MSDDLIKRIREGYNNWDSGYKADGALLGEAADLIEQQAARIAELEARIAANVAEPVGYFLHIASSWAQVSKEFKNDSDVVPLYAAPIASGPRYDWSVSGMKQSETGNWVMAGEGDKE